MERARKGEERQLTHAAAVVALDDAGELAADPRTSPLEAALRSELHTRLSRAIAALPERGRQVLALYYQEDLSLREIGAVLEVSESRVCQLLRKAHEALRGLLPVDLAA